jgi:hypothetical protein
VTDDAHQHRLSKWLDFAVVPLQLAIGVRSGEGYDKEFVDQEAATEILTAAVKSKSAGVHAVQASGHVLRSSIIQQLLVQFPLVGVQFLTNVLTLDEVSETNAPATWNLQPGRFFAADSEFFAVRPSFWEKHLLEHHWKERDTDNHGVTVKAHVIAIAGLLQDDNMGLLRTLVLKPELLLAFDSECIQALIEYHWQQYECVQRNAVAFALHIYRMAVYAYWATTVPRRTVYWHSPGDRHEEMVTRPPEGPAAAILTVLVLINMGHALVTAIQFISGNKP